MLDFLFLCNTGPINTVKAWGWRYFTYLAVAVIGDTVLLILGISLGKCFLIMVKRPGSRMWSFSCRSA